MVARSMKRQKTTESRWSRVWAGLLLVLLCAAPPMAAQAQAWQDKVDAHVLDALDATGQARFILVLSEQADLSGAAALRTKEEKGAFVYDALREVALRTQGPVAAALSALGAPVRRYYVANAIASSGPQAVVQAMALRPDVAHVAHVWTGRLGLPDQAGQEGGAGKAQAVDGNITNVKADQVWALGITGQGTVVGGSDTGYTWDHPALKNQYRGWDGATASHDFNWHDAVHAGSVRCQNDSPTPCDDDPLFSHGTHTMGTVAGNDLAASDPAWPAGAAHPVGLAPGAQWIGCRNLFGILGDLQTYLECNEWHLAPYPFGGDPMTDGEPSKAAHAINNSWACVEGCPTSPPPEHPSDPDPDLLRVSVRNLRTAGVYYVQSIGNDGPDCSTAAFPAGIYAEAFGVGAYNHRNNQVADFSSRGPVLTDGSLRMKPEISAPGVSVLSSSSVNPSGYARLSGTSMAGPHVVGLVALIISANPALAGQVDLIQEIIEQSAVPTPTTDGCGGDGPTDVPNNTFGWGRIDALEAVNQALAQIPLVEARLFLEGPYEAGQMNADLADALPTSQPYQAAPWHYAGGESVPAGFFDAHPDVVDWVLLELRADPASVAGRRAALLRSDGSVVDLDGAGPVGFPELTGLPLDARFVAVFHRNHLAAMSPAAVAPAGNLYAHDFRGGAAFGFNPLKDLGGGAFGLYAGDGDGDGQVQNDDKNVVWRAEVGLAGYRAGDFNLNGQVQNDDKNGYWRPNVGRASPVNQ